MLKKIRLVRHLMTHKAFQTCDLGPRSSLFLFKLNNIMHNVYNCLWNIKLVICIFYSYMDKYNMFNVVYIVNMEIA